MKKVDKQKTIRLLEQTLIEIIQIKTSIKLSIITYQSMDLNYSQLEKDLDSIEHTIDNLKLSIELLVRDITK